MLVVRKQQIVNKSMTAAGQHSGTSIQYRKRHAMEMVNYLTKTSEEDLKDRCDENGDL